MSLANLENEDVLYDEVTASVERLFHEEHIDYFREADNFYTSINDFTRIRSVFNDRLMNHVFGQRSWDITMTSDIVDDDDERLSVSESTCGLGSPTNMAAVEALEKVRYYRPSYYDENNAEKCTICLEDLVTGSELTRMPCNHMFHGDCIVEWLKKRVTCPLCRFELPGEC